MYRAFLRVSVFFIAAALTALSIATLSARSPETLRIAGFAAQAADSVGTALSGQAEAAPMPAPSVTETSYARAEDLPASGTAELFDLMGPHVAGEPALQFTARQLPPLPAAAVLHTAFGRIGLAPMPALALARLPQARPTHVFLTAEEAAAIPNTMALGYAPPESGIEAPFDALLGQPQMAEEEDDGLYRPRPRPDPESVLSWLDGRALGQFAPGQHPWVQNPLPPIVFEPAQQKCLAEGIYFEARGESELGQAAVAQVILNRVRNPAYPDTICDVVYQNKRYRHHCQFSFACDGRPELIAERNEWETAKRIALDVTNGKIWIEEVGDSTHYHARYVRPGWGRRMIKVDRIGAHIFYRTRFGGWS